MTPRHAFPTGQGGGRYTMLRKEGMRETCTRCNAVREWSVPARRWMYVRVVEGTTIKVKHVPACGEKSKSIPLTPSKTRKVEAGKPCANANPSRPTCGYCGPCKARAALGAEPIAAVKGDVDGAAPVLVTATPGAPGSSAQLLGRRRRGKKTKAWVTVAEARLGVTKAVECAAFDGREAAKFSVAVNALVVAAKSEAFAQVVTDIHKCFRHDGPSMMALMINGTIGMVTERIQLLVEQMEEEGTSA